MNKIKIFGLGGLNESGKNMYIVEVNNDIFIFDAGLKYADDSILGIDYIIPNYDYLIENKDRIKGVFITHGHDEQMGAIPDILVDIPDLKIYGTKFTLEMLKYELIEEKLPLDNLIEIEAHRKIDFNDVSIFPLTVTHSIPDAVAYVINTRDGAIVYTGNFIFDSTMLDSYKTDIGKLAYVGKQGVLCLLSESLYSEKKGYTSPRHRMYDIINETLNKYNQRVICNIYSNQIFRIQEVLNAVCNTDRNIVIMGKKLEDIIYNAIDKNYIKFDKSRIKSIRNVNDEGIVILLSDEREKAFMNLQRIVKGYDKFIKLNNDDTVIFISPIYPGSEKTASRIFDRLSRMEVNVVTLSNKDYIDLHASSEDLMMMINLMSPKYYFPVIGQYRHQIHNKKAAMLAGIKEDNILVKLNGQVVEFNDGKLVDSNLTVPVDDIMIDGKTVGDIGEMVLKDREILSDNGVVIVTASIDRVSKKIINGPKIITKGFMYVRDNSTLIEEAVKISKGVIEEFNNGSYIEFNKVKSGIRDKLGKYLYKQTECQPMILVVLQEISLT